MFHYLLILFKFGLIRKYTCILNLHSKLFSTVYIKLRLGLKFKKININQQRKRSIIQKASFFHLFRKITRIMIRIKKILNFKKLKCGILSSKKNFKTNYKHRIQKFWHKFWHKCFRYNLNGAFPKMRIISQKKVPENCDFKFFFPRKKNIFYFKNYLVGFFFLRSENYIRKVLIAKERMAYNLLIFLNTFKGYVNYKTLHFFLSCLENFRGISKMTEQIGRQKILQFHYEKKKIVYEKKIFQIDNVTEKTTQQVLKRRVMLLLWLKNNFLYVKNLGKKIAAFENKGLKRIDTKVIHRILSDLIRLGFVKIVKIYIQLYCKKIKMIEFITEKHNNIFSFKKAIGAFSQNIQKNICKYELKKKKLFCYNNHKYLFFNIKNTFSSKKKLKKNNFLLKTSYILTLKTESNIQFSKNRAFSNLCFGFQEIFVSFTLDFIKAHVFSFFYLKKKYFSNSNTFYLWINFKKQIDFLKNFLLTKIFFVQKKISSNVFFYNFLQKFYRMNIEKIHIIITSRFFLKNKIFNQIKNFVFLLRFEIFLPENFFMYEITNNLKKKKNSVYKWDCEIDVKIYSYFVCFFFKKNKQNNYKKLAFLKQGFYRRRIGRLRLIPNMKIIYSFFEKTIKFPKTFYFKNSIKYLYQTIKRSLEFPSNYFFLDILINKSISFHITRNKIYVAYIKNELYDISSENIFYFIWKFLFKKIFSLCNFIFKGFLIFFYQRFTFTHLRFLIFAVKNFEFLKKKEKKNSNFFSKLKKSIFFYLFFTKLFKEKKIYSILHKDLLKKKIFLDTYNKNKLTIVPFFVITKFIYAQKFRRIDKKENKKINMEIRVSFADLYTNYEKKYLFLVQSRTERKKKRSKNSKELFFFKKNNPRFLWHMKIILNKKTNRIIKEILHFFRNKAFSDACLNNFLEFRNYIMFWVCFDIVFCLPGKKNLNLFIFNFIFKKKFLANQFYNEIYFLTSFFSSECFFQDIIAFQKIGFFFTSFHSFKKKIALLRYQYKANLMDIDHGSLSSYDVFNHLVLY